MLFRMEGRWRGKCDDCGRIAARSNDEKMPLLAELKGQGWRSYASSPAADLAREHVRSAGSEERPDAYASPPRSRSEAAGVSANQGPVKYRLACPGCVKDWAQNTERLI